MVFTLIAGECEVIEVVLVGNLIDLMIELVSAGKTRALTGHYIVRGSAARAFTAAVPYGRIAFAAVRVHIETVFTGSLNLKSQVRSIDFEMIIIIKVAYAHDNRTL